jgi:hypothetical protein
VNTEFDGQYSTKKSEPYFGHREGLHAKMGEDFAQNNPRVLSKKCRFLPSQMCYLSCGPVQVTLFDQVAHEAQVQLGFDMPVKVVLGHQVFQRNGWMEFEALHLTS